MQRLTPPHRWPALLVGLTAFAIVGTTISPALGGPGLLTKQEAKRFFYTKKRAKKTFYTKRKSRKGFYTKGRAEARFLDSTEASARFLDPSEGSARFLSPSDADARYLTPAQGDSSYLQPSGETRITVAAGQWIYEPTSSDFDGVRNADGLLVIRTGSPGPDQDLYLSPTLPNRVYGQPMSLSAVELCYDAGETTLVQVEVVRVKATVADPMAGGTDLIDDTTPRNDSACRVYALDEPKPLDQSMVGIALRVDLDGGLIMPTFTLTRTTFVLVP